MPATAGKLPNTGLSAECVLISLLVPYSNLPCTQPLKNVEWDRLLEILLWISLKFQKNPPCCDSGFWEKFCKHPLIVQKKTVAGPIAGSETSLYFLLQDKVLMSFEDSLACPVGVQWARKMSEVCGQLHGHLLVNKTIPLVIFFLTLGCFSG